MFLMQQLLCFKLLHISTEGNAPRHTEVGILVWKQ